MNEIDLNETAVKCMWFLCCKVLSGSGAVRRKEIVLEEKMGCKPVLVLEKRQSFLSYFIDDTKA